MIHKMLVHRRGVLRGAAALAATGLVGARSRSALAQSAQGVSDNEILIGALGQLNGPFAFIGVPGRDNMQITIDKLNSVGGINGRKLKLLFEQASTPAELVAAAKKLVEDDKVFVLVIATGSTGRPPRPIMSGRRKYRPTTPLARRRSFASRSRVTYSTAPFRRRA